jgi:hypothetical protein
VLGTVRVREISNSVDFVSFNCIAHDRKLRKVPREFFSGVYHVAS